MPKRPVFDWVLEAFAVVALAMMCGMLDLHWKDLPAEVPMHFGISGEPDGWGSKSGMLLLPLTAVGLYTLLTLSSRYQRLINIPMAIDRDSPEVQRLLRGLSTTLKVVVLWVLAYLEWAGIETALGRAAGLGKLFLPIAMLALFSPLGLYLYKLRAHRKNFSQPYGSGKIG